MFKYRSTLRAAAFGAVSVAALAAAAPLYAQPAGAPAATAAAGNLEEVVVTARRRDERLLDVPVQVTVVDPNALRSASVLTARDLMQFVPSLTVGTGNVRDFQRLTIRGQGVTLGAGEGVTSYFAEAPIPQFGAGGYGSYLDLENVQVLNGPQGTLFGRNTTGGAVLFTPKRPVFHNEGSLQVGYGNYNNREVTGVGNVVLVPDVLSLRLAGEIRKRDGFTHNYWDGSQYDNINYRTVRAGLLYKPSDRFENYLVLSSMYSNNGGTSFILTDVNPTGLQATTYGLNAPTAAALAVNCTVIGTICTGVPPMGLLGYQALQQSLGIRTTIATAQHFNYERTLRAINVSTFNLSPELLIKNIMSFDRQRLMAGFDIDTTPNPQSGYLRTEIAGYVSSPGQAKTDYLTEELQFQGKFAEDKIDWVVGGFYSHYYPTGSDRVGEDVINFNARQRRILAEKGWSRALFGQASIDLGLFVPALDRLKVTGGYRYTWDGKSYLNSATNIPSNTCAGAATGRVAPNCAVVFAGTWKHPTWTAGLDYKLNPDTLLYGKVGTGYKSGGFNTGLLPANPLTPFGPESVTDYEIGTKANLRLGDDAVMRVELAAFRDNYKDIQRTTNERQPDTNPPVFFNVVRNASRARIEGIELTVDGRFGPIDVKLAVDKLHARYTNYLLCTTVSACTDLKGQDLPHSPRTKVGGSVVYHLPTDPQLGDISISAGGSYQSTYRTQDVSSPQVVLGDFALFNAGARWDNVAGRPIHLEAFVTNLLDKGYAYGSFPYYFLLGHTGVTYVEPRMFGVRARYEFGQ